VFNHPKFESEIRQKDKENSHFDSMECLILRSGKNIRFIWRLTIEFHDACPIE